MKNYFILIFLGVLISGCQATTFGVPTTTWNTLTPDQKQSVIDGYNQQQSINAAVMPLNNLILMSSMPH